MSLVYCTNCRHETAARVNLCVHDMDITGTSSPHVLHCTYVFITKNLSMSLNLNIQIT